MKKLVVLCLQMGGILCLLLVATKTAIAQEKVVVIPMNSSYGKIPNNTSPCTSTIAGTIRWTGSVFEGCDGSYWGHLSLTANVPTVISDTGRVWMDRNLGALQVATSSSDSLAYGNLYQWGRSTDGHEEPTSLTFSTLSSSNVPGHGKFILVNSSPYDWRIPKNDNLWQVDTGTNNPCPSGFRVPTRMEWETEISFWSIDDFSGAFDSPLKLVVTPFRNPNDGSVTNGSSAFYWSSTVATVNGNEALGLYIGLGGAGSISRSRANGYSVRCIRAW